MLSICIPIYNFDVQNLVKDLHQQCLDASIVFEIVCFDDGSKESFKKLNRNIQNLSFINYVELPKNLGRSKIRNELGRMAKYPYLIFMDCDSATVDKKYIANYVQGMKQAWRNDLDKKSLNRPRTRLGETIESNIPFELEFLLYGGRVYKKEPPTNHQFFFHWTYGSKREQVSPENRQKKEHHAFMTNNFLIPKQLFLDIQFDESLTQYGHEDTLFGLELKKRNTPIVHINNPLIHIGLETTEVFLMKTKMGVQNLHFLSKKTSLIESKLLNTYKRFRQVKLDWILRLGYAILEKKMVANFHSSKPNMRLFDLYKLGYLATYDSSNV